MLLVDRGNAMLTSTECRARAEQKIAEAEHHPRRRKKLRADAECWLVFADRMKWLEASLQAVELLFLPRLK
jgi:hypothetical protein